MRGACCSIPSGHWWDLPSPAHGLVILVLLRPLPVKLQPKCSPCRAHGFHGHQSCTDTASAEIERISSAGRSSDPFATHRPCLLAYGICAYLLGVQNDEALRTIATSPSLSLGVRVLLIGAMICFWQLGGINLSEPPRLPGLCAGSFGQQGRFSWLART